jgi:hypothetical protein
VIYVNAGDAIGSSLRALNAETGALIWLRRFGPDSGTFSPTFAADKLAGQPDAGHVLIYHTPSRGLPESRFRL